MTHQEIYNMLASTNIPTVYLSWKIDTTPNLPYIVYYYPTSDDFVADNINFQSINALNIELYTANKDFTTESLIESVLKNNSLAFRKTETWLESEDMYQILYETEVIIDG